MIERSRLRGKSGSTGILSRVPSSENCSSGGSQDRDGPSSGGRKNVAGTHLLQSMADSGSGGGSSF